MYEPAVLYEERADEKVQCLLCAHRCIINKGASGICGVRKNEGGKLYSTTYGRAVAAGLDPIEKKPLYHFLPGTSSFSIAANGCNFKCGFCQNWHISQAGEDSNGSQAAKLMPQEIVRKALDAGAASISYTYTEPTVFFEYALDTAKLAAENGIKNVFVTNGYMTKQALDIVSPHLDAANIDLKYFRDESYSKICKARLQPVLDSIQNMYDLQGQYLQQLQLHHHPF